MSNSTVNESYVILGESYRVSSLQQYNKAKKSIIDNLLGLDFDQKSEDEKIKGIEISLVNLEKDNLLDKNMLKGDIIDELGIILEYIKNNTIN